MISFLKNLFSSRNNRLIEKYQNLVFHINNFESSISLLSDEQLRNKTNEFRLKYAKGISLNNLLPEAFSVVREASKRVFKMRHFDVQLIGGIALHNGKIAEMKTGEGKTLMATLSAYLNALSNQGVHIVTVNDYLAYRDSQWMGKLYNFLGMNVGVIMSNQEIHEKKIAYNADITYGTNNEFCFDYLRDNMEYRTEDRRQRVPLAYAILDEIDSILIDEARTPLIISGESEDQTELYSSVNKVSPLLSQMLSEPKPNEPEPAGDFWIDEKNQQIHLSEAGHENAEKILKQMGFLPKGESLYDSKHINLMHHLAMSLRAHNLFFRDKQYIVQNGNIVIVDEFTGRLMIGRRWSDGLHQAVEAKEGVKINHENRTLASITFQNYFRMYKNLSGMTGTANTEAYEFQDIYGLETVIIPTNKKMIRNDQNDQIFKTNKEKYEAILNDVQDCYNVGQPVLVGTTNIETSEFLSKLFTKRKLPHQILNAKHHAHEASIIAEAGKPGSITIATNMAGRGTDIVLGGNIEKLIEQINSSDSLDQNEKSKKIRALFLDWTVSNEKVKSAGGLRIIGTERHESRRIDNQLRGRSGRQGDPGSSRFYLSLEDPLMRIFSGDKLRSIMNRLNLPDGEAIESTMVNRAIENAQRKVESRNFDARKQLLEYDDVSNNQRLVLYEQRNKILESKSITSEFIKNLCNSILMDFFSPYEKLSPIEIKGKFLEIQENLRLELNILLLSKEEIYNDSQNITHIELLEKTSKKAEKTCLEKSRRIGKDRWSSMIRTIFLQSIDFYWHEHLSSLDYLRQGIYLRSYAQKNPKQEYKRDAFELFSSMLNNIKKSVVKHLMIMECPISGQTFHPKLGKNYIRSETGKYNSSSMAIQKIGRNKLCPCGSGKKFKHCHGALS